MKWGRKKASLSSSSRPSLVSSWLAKFKKMGSSSSDQKPERAKHRGRLNSPAGTSSCQYTSGKGMSSGEKGADKCTSRSVVQSAWYDSYDELDVPGPNCQSCRSTCTIPELREDTKKFSNMVSGARKTREMSIEASLLPKLNICKGEVDEDFDTPRRVARRDCKLLTQDRRCLEQNLSAVEEESDAADIKPERVSENESVEHGSVKTIRTYVSSSRMYGDGSSIKSKDSYPETKEKDCVLFRLNMDKGDGVYDSNVSPDWQKLKELKIAEFKAKTEKQRKSVHMSRELQRNKPKQGCKVGVFSPKITSKVEICKIKALEDMKKANRLRMKKKIRERMEGGKSNLENFAVVKCSYDPPKDFRDSMIEMIIEKRMHQPEELEKLLACYLTLNSDEYHDLIIKVFKEVWFHLNQESFRTEFQDQCCY